MLKFRIKQKITKNYKTEVTMKRIAIYRHKWNNIVTHLQIIPESKTEDEVKESVKRYNSEYSTVAVEEVSDSVYEAFQFCLGESDYKKMKTVEDLCVTMEDLQKQLNLISESVESLSSDVDFTLRNVKKFLKEE